MRLTPQVHHWYSVDKIVYYFLFADWHTVRKDYLLMDVLLECLFLFLCALLEPLLQQRFTWTEVIHAPSHFAQ